VSAATFGWNSQALSASPLSHAERPLGLAFLLYPAFSCGVQRNSTRAVDGFLMGGLPRFGLSIGVIVRTQISLDKRLDPLYSVRTVNQEGQMKATVTIAAFYVTCPKCDAEIESPDGSLMWSVNEKAPEKIECLNCKTVLTLPAKYASLVR
jgi:hypothetical protein